MADAYLPQPIRTLTNGDAVVEICDGTTNTQKLAVDSSGRITTKMDDGAGNAITSQTNGAQRALDVGIDVAGVQIDPRQIRTLTSADIVTANQGTANSVGNAWPIEVTDGTHTAAVKAASTAAVVGDQSLVVALSPNSPVPVGSNLIGKIEVTDGTNVAGVAPASTAATTLQPALVVAQSPNSPTPAGTNLIGGATVYVGSSAATLSNPVPVTITNSTPGTLVNHYSTTASVAANATATNIYTITSGKTFSGKLFWASASGKIRADVATSPDGSTYTTYWTGFSSPSNPNIMIPLESTEIQDSGTGSTIKITITNEDTQSFDVFSTISGIEN